MQYSLLAPLLPPGFRYLEEFVASDGKRLLVSEIEKLDLERVEMRGGIARRRIAHFGWTYGFDSRRSDPGAPIPDSRPLGGPRAEPRTHSPKRS